MNFNVYICQLISTVAFILTCSFILSPAKHKFYKFLLYGYIAFCRLILTPFVGPPGTPVMLLGSFVILLAFSPAKRFYNLIFFQAIWFWRLLTSYALTIPLNIARYDFSDMRSSLRINLFFSLLHALLCVLPCCFLGRRLRRSPSNA